jgi:TRAP-type C4-dicarboxylate transport system substrate-binding protein
MKQLLARTRIVAGAAAIAMAGAAPAVAQVELLFSAFAPPNDIINTRIIHPWAKRVEAATAGRVRIKFSPTSLAAPQQQWEMVTQGVADAAYLFNGFQQNRLILPQIAHLPFLSPSAEASAVALWRTHERIFAARNEYADVQLVGLIVGPTGQFYSLTDRPLDSIERFRNLKTWGLPGVPARALDKLGASVVPGPAVRIHDIVSKGVVDAFVGIGPYHAETYNAGQFAKSITILPGGISAPSFSVIVNKAKWNAIPEPDQALVMGVSGEALARVSAVYDEANQESLERLEKAGMKRIVASPEFAAQLRQHWAFLESEWIANAAKRNVDGKAALAHFREQLTAAAKR